MFVAETVLPPNKLRQERHWRRWKQAPSWPTPKTDRIIFSIRDKTIPGDAGQGFVSLWLA